MQQTGVGDYLQYQSLNILIQALQRHQKRLHLPSHWRNLSSFFLGSRQRQLLVPKQLAAVLDCQLTKSRPKIKTQNMFHFQLANILVKSLLLGVYPIQLSLLPWSTMRDGCSMFHSSQCSVVDAVCGRNVQSSSMATINWESWQTTRKLRTTKN